jgi:hypothetical protein
MFQKVKKHFTEIKSTTASNDVTTNVCAVGGKAATGAATGAAAADSGDGGLKPSNALSLEQVTLFSR